MIRRRAYDLWVAAGRPEGSSLRFWKEAEAQIAKFEPESSLETPNQNDR